MHFGSKKYECIWKYHCYNSAFENTIVTTANEFVVKLIKLKMLFEQLGQFPAERKHLIWSYAYDHFQVLAFTIKKNFKPLFPHGLFVCDTGILPDVPYVFSYLHVADQPWLTNP